MLKQQERLFLLLGSTGYAFHEVRFFLFPAALFWELMLLFMTTLVPPDGLSVLFQIEPGVFSILCYWFPNRYRYTILFFPSQESLTICILSLQSLLQTLQTTLAVLKLLTVLDQNWFLEDFFLSKLCSLLSYPALDPAFQ